MRAFQSYKKLIALAGVGIALGSGVLVASADQSLSSTTVSFEQTAGDLISQLDAWLHAQKAQLEQEIAGLGQQENATSQTTIGQQITQTTGIPVSPHAVGTAEQTFTRLWKQLLLIAVDVAIFIVEHTWLLYTVLAILALIIIKFVLRLIF